MSPQPGRVRAWVIYSLALVVPALSIFAIVGSVVATPTFAPVSLHVPTGVVVLVALTAILFAGVGALVAVRARHNVIGWLLLGIGWCTSVTLAGIVVVALELPASRWAEWVSSWVSVMAFVLVTYVLLLFPDGHLVSPRWRPALWLTHAAGLAFLIGGLFTPYVNREAYVFDNPLGVNSLRGRALDGDLGWYLLPLAMVGGVASFVVRYRRSRGVLRAQLKWFAFAAAIVLFGYLFFYLTWEVSVLTAVDLTALGLVVVILCFNAVPVASGFAMLRYRLYEIDRLVSRTVTYLGVTSIVLGVYLVLVAAATAVLPARSSLAVAGATLVAAAVFEPSRRRVQTLVDRRFNRARYDAINTIDAFGRRLRDDVDPDQVRRDLVGTVTANLQPGSITVWTREPTRPTAPVGAREGLLPFESLPGV